MEWKGSNGYLGQMTSKAKIVPKYSSLSIMMLSVLDIFLTSNRNSCLFLGRIFSKYRNYFLNVKK
ncbi:hypothetical protein [Wolbachia endosymbiont of Pentidionis agamae]|uniref:hypothetical protein n=1 Tax=Wolbachia endosymbiont of Pentidionis agamae TaxID=3110435 RepID=UPI002FD03C35